MTSATDDGKRHIYGPRPLGALVPMLVRPAFRKRSPAMAQALADWDAIVGPAIAAVAAPRKLFAGTLSIVCSGPMAVELQHLSEQLIGRINAHLGQIAVTRLRFTQDLRQPPPPSPKPPRPRPRPMPAPLSPCSRPGTCVTRWRRWAAPCWPATRHDCALDSPAESTLTYNMLRLRCLYHADLY